jgi:hypothetical protein
MTQKPSFSPAIRNKLKAPLCFTKQVSKLAHSHIVADTKNSAQQLVIPLSQLKRLFLALLFHLSRAYVYSIIKLKVFIAFMYFPFKTAHRLESVFNFVVILFVSSPTEPDLGMK